MKIILEHIDTKEKLEFNSQKECLNFFNFKISSLAYYWQKDFKIKKKWKIIKFESTTKKEKENSKIKNDFMQEIERLISLMCLNKKEIKKDSLCIDDKTIFFDRVNELEKESNYTYTEIRDMYNESGYLTLINKKDY